MCNPRNEGKPVHVSHCHESGLRPVVGEGNSLFPSPHFGGSSWGCSPPCHLCDCPNVAVSLLIQLTVMASSDDTEGSLTPVDFIQLQHYMECKYHPSQFTLS